MCGCHGNAWRSSSENSIFHNAMLYWSCVPNFMTIGYKQQKLQVLEYFHKKCCYHGNDDSAHTKNDWRLRFTIMHLHAKFEDDPRRTAAGRALTRKSLRQTRRTRRRRRRDEAKSIVSHELRSGDTIMHMRRSVVSKIIHPR